MEKWATVDVVFVVMRENDGAAYLRRPERYRETYSTTDSFVRQASRRELADVIESLENTVADLKKAKLMKVY